METINKRIARLLISNTTWIYITLLFYASFAFTMTIWRGHDDIVYLSAEKWFLCGQYALCFCLHFLPVLLFTGFRNWIHKHVHKSILIITWIYAFLLHPAIVGYFAIDYNFVCTFDGSRIWSIGLIFLVVEGVLFFNQLVYRKFAIGQWLKNVKLEKAILISIIIISALYVLSTFPSSAVEYIFDLSQLLIMVLVYYLFYLLNHYILINRVLRNKGIVYYGFGLLTAIMIFYPILALVIFYFPFFESAKLYVDGSEWIPSGTGPSQFSAMGVAIPLPGMLLTLPFIVVIEWLNQGRTIAALETEKVNAELNLLRQQINPHFFFNTLNNLYALSLTKDEKTPDVILKLSELMRYVINKGNETDVSLKVEIKYLEDYIQLQSLRLQKKLDFSFAMDVEDLNIRIAPLLLITFVENAFKHGIERAENDSFLHLSITCSGQQFVFVCINSVEQKLKSTPGIGLINLKRRLQLLYPEKSKLLLAESPGTYTATLQLTLDRPA